MSNPQFVVYEVASRRLQRVVGIPWAEPAPVVAVPYPSFLAPKSFRHDGLNRKRTRLDPPELNVYPETPPEAATFYPGWVAKAANESRYSARLQLLPQLDRFPVVVAEQPLTAFLAPKQFNIAQKRTLLTPLELDEYPETPVIPDQPMTAFLAPKQFKAEQRRELLQPLELDSYPPPIVPEQPLTAFLEPELFRRHQVRQERRISPLDVYPVTPDAPSDVTFGVFGEITDNGLGVQGIVSASGQGLVGDISVSFGVQAIIKSDGFGGISEI